MRVIICGSRYWNDYDSISSIIEFLYREYKKDLTIIQGAASGADTIAYTIARAMGIKVESFPADWNKYGRAAGPIRNKQMLDAGADLVIGFTESLENSKGTANMINIAKKAGVSTFVFNSGVFNYPINWEKI